MASHHGRLQGWRGGYSRAEDMDRASRGKLSPQGKTSLGLSFRVQESDSERP